MKKSEFFGLKLMFHKFQTSDKVYTILVYRKDARSQNIPNRS